MSDLVTLSLAQASHSIHTLALSPVTYVEALLEHIGSIEPSLQAWVQLDAQSALNQAHQLEKELHEGISRGSLHGIPVAIKDLFDVAGMETLAGSEIISGNIAQVDSTAVARLRQKGAIIMGKTAMTVFAAMDPCGTVNPWNHAHTPGGSSSGSAAAVASRMCPAALGTQTAGSVLRPAAYCGISGLKPTFDAVSRRGLFPCAWSMDHVGVMACSAEDVALVFDAVAELPLPPSRPAFVLGVPDRYFFDELAPDVMTAFAAAIETLREAGVEVREVVLPATFERGTDAGVVTMYAEMAALHRDRFTAQASAYPFRIRTLIEEGLRISAADYLRAQQVRRLCADDLTRTFAEVDCLVTPATPAPAPAGLSATGDWRFNLPFSASGHPAISVPCGFSADGLPIGLQIAAGYRRERRLFDLAGVFQAHTDWHRRRPESIQETLP